ncbi:MAG: hypothetical protein ACKO3L_06470, partial [Actinomycetota bacterium]
GLLDRQADATAVEVEINDLDPQLLAEGGELAEEYRSHFEVDEQGNWVGGDDAEREAAWADYYKEYGQDGATGAEGAPAPEQPAQ